MPSFVLGRNYRLASTLGHVINFQKGQPVDIPAELIPEAVAIGAECVDGPVDVLPPEVQEAIPLTHAERETMCFVAFDVVTGRNKADEFTGAGVPKLSVMKSEAQITDLDTKEVQVYWQKYRESKAG